MSNRLINTTFTGKDISAGTTIVYTYTAAKAATIRFRIGLDAVAGNGDYVFWLTLQRGGAGTVYTVLPKTTGAAAAAETALMVMTSPIDVVTSDVVNVYVDGLAGDTSESGTVEVFEDDYLRPNTAAQYGVDVTAGGEVGIDWANIGSPTTAVGLSGTTVKAVTDGVNLADDAITAAKITADTIGASELAADAVAEIWAYATRTLTMTAAEVVAAISGSTLSVRRGDTYTLPLTGLGSIATRTKLWFTIKTNQSDQDHNALILVEETLGLVYSNGEVGVGANGSITVDDPAAGDITIEIDEVETKKLAPQNNIYYDVQARFADGDVHTLTSGTCHIIADVTRRIDES